VGVFSEHNVFYNAKFVNIHSLGVTTSLTSR